MKNILEMKNTNTIRESSTVPANIPTIPTVQFKGRTLKKKYRKENDLVFLMNIMYIRLQKVY